MKKLLSMISAIVLCASFAFAQSNETTPTKEMKGPQMEFEAKELDYGTIAQNSDPYRSFSFTNVGDEPVQITHAKGSCGCTTPDWPKEPIFPGESAEIKVRYDTKRIGKFVKRVTLTTNMKDPKVVLTIKGEVKPAAPEPEGVPTSSPSIFAAPNGN